VTSDKGTGVKDVKSGRVARKSPSAFRTIGEASEDLGVPQHVLRFWETKFTQLKPLKRAGGRRYYRPEDMGLLTHIRDLLYREGFTIKGAQRSLGQRGGAGTKSNAEAPQAEEAAEAETPPSNPALASLFEGPEKTGGTAVLARTLREVLDELTALRCSIDSKSAKN